MYLVFSKYIFRVKSFGIFRILASFLSVSCGFLAGSCSHSFDEKIRGVSAMGSGALRKGLSLVFMYQLSLG